MSLTAGRARYEIKRKNDFYFYAVASTERSVWLLGRLPIEGVII